jgi:hypothetical protein
MVCNACPLSITTFGAFYPKNDRPLRFLHQLQWEQKMVNEMALHVLERWFGFVFDQVLFYRFDFGGVG